MAILIGDLYEDTKQQFQMKLVAGAAGLDRIVNWVYIAEDVGNARFLQGAELVVSTGFASSFDKNWFLPFLKALIEKDTCGLILNVGKYVWEEDVTEEVIRLCETHSYPLFVIPWDVHHSDLTQNYYNRIFAFRQNKYNLETALKSILQEGELLPQAREILEDVGFRYEDSFTVAVAQVEDLLESDSKRLHLLQRLSSFCPSAKKLSYVIFPYRKQFVFVWHQEATAAIVSHIEEFLAACGAEESITSIYLGLSRTMPGTRGLKSMYRQAQAALYMAAADPRKWYSFEELGCYQIFFETSDWEVLKDYVTFQLGALEEYDLYHGNLYIKTLEVYLRNNQHLETVANELICHRNTVNYRINKIREVLHVDFNDAETKFHLLLALHIRNFLEIYEK